MNTENTKALIYSTTFQGALVSILGFIFTFFKVPIANEEIGQIISALVVLAGICISIYGRYKAKEKIGGIFRV